MPPPLLDVALPEPLPVPPELEPPELEPPLLDAPELPPPELPLEGVHELEEPPQADSRGSVTTASADRREGRMFTAADNRNLGASAAGEKSILGFAPSQT